MYYLSFIASLISLFAKFTSLWIGEAGKLGIIFVVGISVLFSSRKSIIDKKLVMLIFLAFLVLFFSTVSLLFNTDVIRTDVWQMPIIYPVNQLKQLTVGVLYDIKFIFFIIIFMMGLYCAKNPDFVKGVMHGLILFFVLNFFFSFYELYNKDIHYKLYYLVGYEEGYSFSYRGLSLLLNTYEAGLSFSISTLIGLLLFTRYRLTGSLVILLSILGVLVIGTRIALIYTALLIILFTVFESKDFFKLFIKIIFLLFIFLVFLAVAYEYSEDVRILLDSLFFLYDEKGSTQLHFDVFMGSLKLIIEYPFGIGAGRVNFSAGHENLPFNPESYLLAITLNNGIVYLLLFTLVYYYFYCYCLSVTYSDTESAIVKSLLLGSYIISLGNMQIFYSTVIPVIMFLVLVVTSGVSVHGNKIIRR